MLDKNDFAIATGPFASLKPCTAHEVAGVGFPKDDSDSRMAAQLPTTGWAYRLIELAHEERSQAQPVALINGHEHGRRLIRQAAVSTFFFLGQSAWALQTAANRAATLCFFAMHVLFLNGLVTLWNNWR